MPPDSLEFIVQRKLCPNSSNRKKAMLSELGLLAEGKTSEVSFREVLTHMLAKEYLPLPTSFTVPTAPQEPPVPS